MKVGLVYYADDPHQRVFRKVIQQVGDTDDVFSVPSVFTVGVDPARQAVIRIVEADSPDALADFGGTPWTEADAPLPAADPYRASPELVAAVLDLAQVGPADTLFDLGSGLGPFLIGAARRGAGAVGIEIDPDLAEQSRAAASAEGLTIDVRVGDYTTADLSGATVIVLNLAEVPERAWPEGARVVAVIDGVPTMLVT